MEFKRVVRKPSKCCDWREGAMPGEPECSATLFDKRF
jgi:hypothetical protein